MTKSFRYLGAALAILLLGCVASQAQGRIATLELNRVFKEYWKTKQSELALKESETEYKKEFESMQEDRKKLLEVCRKMDTEANDQAVSSEEREKRQKALEPKIKELRELEAAMKEFEARNVNDLKMKSARLRETVLKDIKTVVATKARAGSYAYVIDSGAQSLTQTEVFLYSSGETDLTDAVVKELNAAAPPEYSK